MITKNLVSTEKLKLEDVSISIHSKRNVKLDNEFFDFYKLQLSDYDIRETRDITRMKEDLLRDGQLQVITVTKNKREDGTFEYIIINGRTRYLAMKLLNEEHEDIFAFVRVEVYEDLTELEQDYLNAQINVSQKTLTSNEKLAFVEKYQYELDAIELGNALALSPSQVQKYKATAKIPAKARVKFSQESEGYGRGEINVETAGDCVLSYESQTNGVTPNTETLETLGDAFGDMKMNRDVKRKLVREVSKKTAILQKDKRVVSKYTTEEIVNIAVKESRHNNNDGGSGDELPKNSSKKYKILDKQLKGEKYEFAVLLFAESLYRTNEKKQQVESETKRIIDAVDEIIVNGNEELKLMDTEEYCKGLKKTITTHNGDAMVVCRGLKSDKRKGLIYVNGASNYAQRPEFINYLKEKYPNSTIMVVALDLLFGISRVVQEKRDREIITVYGGAKNFNDVIAFVKKRVKNISVQKYATTPQLKYIYTIKP